jgi:hypothetical protein
MNPFRETILADPWRNSAATVPEIQADVFDHCLRGIDHVRANRRSAGIVIHGAAGSGKTHLISRLRSHLTLKAPTATDRAENLFVWVRLQASPRMIWRHLRRTLVEDWFRPVPGARSQFERILFHRLAAVRVASGDLEPWYEFMRDEHPADLERHLEQVADQLDLDRNTTVAFKHLAFERHRRDLRAWLGGDSLPEEALGRLGLSQDEGTDEEREHEASRVVLMLCKLAGDDLPILLSLDQVEALKTTPSDRDGLFAFGQVVSRLHDETTNLLIVSSVQSTFLTEMKDASRGADYDRMTSLGARSLATLTRSQAESLIAARLGAANDNGNDNDSGRAVLEQLRPSSASRIWPLDEADWRAMAERGDATPRRLLATCAERFDAAVARRAHADSKGDARSDALRDTGRETRGTLDDGRSLPSPEMPETSHVPTVPAFLGDEFNSRVEQALAINRPEQTEAIARHGLPLLLNVIAPGTVAAPDDRLRDVAFVVDGPLGRTGVSVCTQPNMNSLGAQLKRLKQQFATKHISRLILIRETRVPISPGATKTMQSLQELERDGAIVALPSPQALAALDALRALLSDAKSGDLAHAGEGIAPRTVEEWLRVNLTEELLALGELISGSAPHATGHTPASPHTQLELEELSALLNERPLLPLDEAAEFLKRPAATIASLAGQHPDRIGLLTGPPAVLFRVTNDAAVEPLQ